MTPITILWIKVWSHLFLGFTCALLVLGALRLLKEHSGHRFLLWIRSGFFAPLAVAQFIIAKNTYYHGVNFAFMWQAAASVMGMWYGLYAWKERVNICKTFRSSESKTHTEWLEETSEAKQATAAFDRRVRKAVNMKDEMSDLRRKQECSERAR